LKLFFSGFLGETGMKNLSLSLGQSFISILVLILGTQLKQDGIETLEQDGITNVLKTEHLNTFNTKKFIAKKKFTPAKKALTKKSSKRISILDFPKH
jgi:hypothetical protein